MAGGRCMTTRGRRRCASGALATPCRPWPTRTRRPCAAARPRWHSSRARMRSMKTTSSSGAPRSWLCLHLPPATSLSQPRLLPSGAARAPAALFADVLAQTCSRRMRRGPLSGSEPGSQPWCHAAPPLLARLSLCTLEPGSERGRGRSVWCWRWLYNGVWTDWRASSDAYAQTALVESKEAQGQGADDVRAAGGRRQPMRAALLSQSRATLLAKGHERPKRERAAGQSCRGGEGEGEVGAARAGRSDDAHLANMLPPTTKG